MGTPVIVSYIWRKSRFVKLNEHNVFLCARERKRVGELGWRVIDTIQNKRNARLCNSMEGELVAKPGVIFQYYFV